jgi:hypothetical protein
MPWTTYRRLKAKCEVQESRWFFGALGVNPDEKRLIGGGAQTGANALC